MASSFHKTFLSINVHYILESRLALYNTKDKKVRKDRNERKIYDISRTLHYRTDKQL